MLIIPKKDYEHYPCVEEVRVDMAALDTDTHMRVSHIYTYQQSSSFVKLHINNNAVLHEINIQLNKNRFPEKSFH